MPRSTAQRTQQRILYGVVISVMIAIIVLVILGKTGSTKDSRVPVKSLNSAQQADAPLGFPLPSTKKAPSFDPRFIQLTAFERALIPTATRMAAAMGTAHGALSYNAQHYWDNNPARGGHHTGDDINGIGGMNTDLGDPVYAIGNGMIVYRGEPSLSWGNTLIVAHRNTQGEILLSMYSHLDKSYAAHGQRVHLGEVIGTVGTANNNYPAHLHLEMRDSTGIYIGPGYTSNQGEFLSPSQTILKGMGPPPDNLFPSALSIAIKNQQQRRKEYFFNCQ